MQNCSSMLGSSLRASSAWMFIIAFPAPRTDRGHPAVSPGGQWGMGEQSKVVGFGNFSYHLPVSPTSSVPVKRANNACIL